MDVFQISEVFDRIIGADCAERKRELANARRAKHESAGENTVVTMLPLSDQEFEERFLDFEDSRWIFAYFDEMQLKYAWLECTLTETEFRHRVQKQVLANSGYSREFIHSHASMIYAVKRRKGERIAKDSKKHIARHVKHGGFAKEIFESLLQVLDTSELTKQRCKRTVRVQLAARALGEMRRNRRLGGTMQALELHASRTRPQEIDKSLVEVLLVLFTEIKSWRRTMKCVAKAWAPTDEQVSPIIKEFLAALWKSCREYCQAKMPSRWEEVDALHFLREFAPFWNEHHESMEIIVEVMKDANIIY